MATYSPLYGEQLVLLSNKNPMERAFTRLARRNKKVRELLDTLIGATAGATAQYSESRVQHSTVELGGVRPIEQRVFIDRPTTVDDRANLREMFMQKSRTTNPQNLAGKWSL